MKLLCIWHDCFQSCQPCLNAASAKSCSRDVRFRMARLAAHCLSSIIRPMLGDNGLSQPSNLSCMSLELHGSFMGKHCSGIEQMITELAGGHDTTPHCCASSKDSQPCLNAATVRLQDRPPKPALSQHAGLQGYCCAMLCDDAFKKWLECQCSSMEAMPHQAGDGQSNGGALIGQLQLVCFLPQCCILLGN